MKLYGCPSPNVTKVAICLEEMSLPYEYIYVSISEGEQFTPEFHALNPSHKVPVLTDETGPGGGPLTLFESGAIMIYLSDKTRSFLAPADTADRYEALVWLMWQMANIGPITGQYGHFKFYSPESVPYALSRYFTIVTQLYSVADERLKTRPFIAGETYSIADMALYPWARMMEENQLPSERWPNLQRWIDAMAARPAVQRANAVVLKRLPQAMASLQSAPMEKLDRLYTRAHDPDAAKIAREPRLDRGNKT